ncbi:MAG: membrane protein insertase YidC [Bacteroidota bacterium]
MDKTNLNQIIGIALIMAILFYWAKINAPTEEQLAEQQRIQDSIKAAMVVEEEATPIAASPEQQNLPDSLLNLQMRATHGVFAPSALGEEQTTIIENDLMTVVFTNKGGRIKEVTLKEYQKSRLDSNKVVQMSTLKLLEDNKNKFEYLLPMSSLSSGAVKTSTLYFTPTVNGKTITFRASAGNGKYFEQKYVIQDGTYAIDYLVKLVGLDSEVDASNIELNWVNYLDKIEENVSYEKNYTAAYYYDTEEDLEDCGCTSNEQENPDERIKWVSHSNQFFNSALMAKDGSFKKAELVAEMLDEDGPDLKKLTSKLSIPMESDAFAMNFYIGPNEYDRLKAQGNGLEDIIPYGSSIFGTINRWLIRPAFSFLNSFISSKGISIIVMTLLVKLLLFPLTYKMVYSQQKMAALKPRMSEVKKKFGDDQQAAQMETMKMYREYGVNPLGGCLPIAAQMPIWFALFRFFPASIEFRQASFLWAHDLSSFDVIAWLPNGMEIPFYGAHISLFTLLYGVSMIAYTWYNSKQMDMSQMGGGQQQQMMIYMQYFMPIMFLFFFNNYAAGLTTYMFTSNLMNISQMVFTKSVLIDKDKIEAELKANKAKPKKKGGFSERLAEAMKEQQRIQAQKEATRKKKRR